MSLVGQYGSVRARAARPVLPSTTEVASFYSITSSAVARTCGGTVRPSALAVFRLITSSNLFGACDPGDARRDFLEKFEPFTAHADFEIRELSHVAARPRQIRDHPACDWIKY
jgi:hypothetical protein